MSSRGVRVRDSTMSAMYAWSLPRPSAFSALIPSGSYRSIRSAQTRSCS